MIDVLKYFAMNGKAVLLMTRLLCIKFSVAFSLNCGRFFLRNGFLISDGQSGCRIVWSEFLGITQCQQYFAVSGPLFLIIKYS
uniref:Putative secreted protein n=1 Tax=Panstrongylus lignarius TaxID=156445 RepID=A0A224XWA3_9HEMI